MCNYVGYATQTTQLAQTWYINASLEELCSSINRCVNLAKGFFFHVSLFSSFCSLAVYKNTASDQQQEDCKQSCVQLTRTCC